MSILTPESVPASASLDAPGPFVTLSLIALAALALYFMGWVVPAVVTRAESTAGFRTWVGETFGNAPTAGRVFVGRAR